MSQCSWCGRSHDNTSEYEETFCSLKCLTEYRENGYGLTEKSGCFVATAVYGSYNHHIVYDLRLFRDNWLKNRKWGIRFIQIYYTHGPFYARIIKSHYLLKFIVRFSLIKPMHFLVTKLNLHLNKN